MNASFLTSPVGELTLVATDLGLRAVLWPNDRDGRVPLPALSPSVGDGLPSVLDDAASQLHEYFAGERTTFDLALDLQGSTFQVKVWNDLATIPYGTTVSYAEQARRLGRPTAARAVGAAVGRNPLSIVLPCHRVVATSGHLTGFAGGLVVKRTLLDHERRVLAG